MTRCTSCNAEIRWGETGGGHRIPLNAPGETRLVVLAIGDAGPVVAARTVFTKHRCVGAGS